MTEKGVRATACRQERGSLEGDIYMEAGVKQDRELHKDPGEERQGGETETA